MNELFDKWARHNMADDTGYIDAYEKMERAWKAAAIEAITRMRDAYPRSGCYQILQAHFELEI